LVELWFALIKEQAIGRGNFDSGAAAGTPSTAGLPIKTKTHALFAGRDRPLM